MTRPSPRQSCAIPGPAATASRCAWGSCHGPVALPTGRRGQIVAVAGLAAIVLLLWLGLAAPVLGWYTARADAISQQRTQLDHLKLLVARLPALEARARDASRHAHDPAGASDAQAGADLQQQIAAKADKTGAHLASVEFLEPETVDGYRQIKLRIRP